MFIIFVLALFVLSFDVYHAPIHLTQVVTSGINFSLRILVFLL